MDLSSSLLRDLQNPDDEIRRQAVKSLAEAVDPTRIGHLVEAMGDASWRVRKEASAAVLASGDPAAIPLMIAGLRDETNAGRRNTVVETLTLAGAAVIPQLQPLLHDPDSDVRKFTVDILGGIDSPQVVPALTEALADADENVASSAAEHLGGKRDQLAIPALIEALSSPSFWLKYSALRAIGELADERQEPAILALLGNQTLRIEAISVLARIGGMASLEKLVDWFPRTTTRERRRILEVLGAIIHRLAGHSPAQGAACVALLGREGLRDEFEAFLVEAIRKRTGPERRIAIQVAGFCPSPLMLDTLVSSIDGSDEEERDDISRALTIFPVDYLDRLFPHLGSPSTLVRRKIAWIFGHHRYRAALPRLLPLVGDEDGHVRASVALALGNIADTSAVMPLVQLLADRYPDVRDAAVRALMLMVGTGDDIRRMVREILTASIAGDREKISEGALKVLGQMKDPELLPVFSRFLNDSRVPVRRAALNALGRINEESARELMLNSLTDEDPDIRVEAIRHLRSTEDARSRQAIMSMVHDEDGSVAAEAIKSLGTLGGGDSFAVLETAARTATGLRQVAAIRALSALGTDQAWNTLMALMPKLAAEGRREIVAAMGKSHSPGRLPAVLASLGDPDWSVRLAGIEAACRLAPPEALARVRTERLAVETDMLVRRALESLPAQEA
jgi:HEAT repeat protein